MSRGGCSFCGISLWFVARAQSLILFAVRLSVFSLASSMVVIAHLCRSVAASARTYGAICIPIHPFSSHIFSFSFRIVRSIGFKVFMFSGASLGVFFAAYRLAISISLTFFPEVGVVGSVIIAFRGSFWPKYARHPLRSCVPSFGFLSWRSRIQTDVVSSSTVLPLACLSAGGLLIAWSSVKTLNASVRSPLSVTVGSKVILFPCCRACMFSVILFFVRVRPSPGVGASGFHFEGRWCSSFCAACLHFRGCLHPFSFARLHVLHAQFSFGSSVLLFGRLQPPIPLIVSIRAATEMTSWLFRRHLLIAVLLSFRRCFSAPMWYQIGILVFIVLSSLMAAMFTLFFFAVLIISFAYSGSFDRACVAGFHDCRKVFSCAFWGISPAVLSVCFPISMSRAYAQVGLSELKSRYLFAHMSCSASFLEHISSSPSPPSAGGLCRVSMLIGGVRSCPQMKVRMIFSISFSVCFGIPCTRVRYWVKPPAPIWTMCTLPAKVGLHWFHLCRKVLIFFIMGVHTAAFSTPFPIQAPSTRIGSPSSAILTVSSILSSSWVGLIVLCFLTRSLYSGDPMGMISVFLSLNFALEALHHVSRIFHRSLHLSRWLRKVDVSSAKRAATSFSDVPGILKPCRLDVLSICARGSIAMLNS